MVQQAIDTYGRIDIVVNNAGIVRDRAVWNMSADDFDLVMKVHVCGTWLTCRTLRSTEANAPRRVKPTSAAASSTPPPAPGCTATSARRTTRRRRPIVGLTQTLSLPRLPSSA